jgi:hypothetical protein
VLNLNAASDIAPDEGPKIVTDGAGNWVTTWFSSENLGGVVNSDNDIVVSTSSDNGLTWSPPATLNSNATSDSGADSHADVATDRAGTWLAVWRSNDNVGGVTENDYDLYVSKSIDNGATWSDLALLNSTGNDDLGEDSFPEIVTDQMGNWVTVWHSDENLEGIAEGDYDIFVSTSNDDGTTWSAPALLNINGNFDAGNDLYPEITTDRKGNWVATWFSDENIDGLADADRDVFASTSTDKGVTWSAPALVNINGNFDAGADQYPVIETDGKGTWIVTWNSTENLEGIAEADHDILVAISTDTGTTWSATALLNSNGNFDVGADQTPVITTDGAGNWVTTWRSNEILERGGADSDIFFSTSMDDGATWSDIQILNTNGNFDAGGDLDPSIATDGRRKWMTVWRSTENLGGVVSTDNDIFVSHFTFPQYLLSVPFYLDNAPDMEENGVPAEGWASFVGVKNVSASPVTLRITYTDTQGNDHTPVANTYVLAANSMVSWRPFADDAAEGNKTGRLVPNSVNGPAWGTVRIEADGPITGRLIVLDGFQASTSMMVLPEGRGSNTLSVPFYLDDGSNYVDATPPTDGSASFVGVKNMSDIPVTLTLTYTDTDGTDHTPAENTYLLPANAMVSWRPFADDIVEGDTAGQLVPNTAPASPAWGSILIKADGPITGRLVTVDGANNSTALMLLPEAPEE